MNNVCKYFSIACCFLFGMIITSITILIYVIIYAPLIPEDYNKKIKTGGEIEEKYLNMGSYGFDSYNTKNLMGIIDEYLFYYPDEMKTQNKTYPVIVYLNGEGVLANKLNHLFEHLASWGFIVLGFYDVNSSLGLSADLRLEHLLLLNKDESSVFYKKVDINNVGITGHSAGGLGVFNSINSNNRTIINFKCAASISPSDLTKEKEESFYSTVEKTKIPILMLSGTLKEEFSLEKYNKIYNSINSTKVFARKVDITHNQMLYNADGYITAWFMYYLQNDVEAGNFFRGNDPELLNNTYYQDQQISIVDP